MAIPHEQIDPDAIKVLRRLRRYDYQAYLVGGCVRDLLLHRKPKDFDVATSATPGETKDLFRNCRIIGRRFRLAHIFFGTKIIETSTFRTNPREGLEPEEAASEELLIRRDNVFGTAEEDARRRDFTINGLFYDVQADQVIDYVAGLADLEQRLVRTIGDPEIRFREDPVRILRAIKFAARLDFVIEPATYRAMLTHKGELSKCAAPRILEEVYRLLRGGAARRSIQLLRETGVAQVLVPELERLFRGYRAALVQGAASAEGEPDPDDAHEEPTSAPAPLTAALDGAEGEGGVADEVTVIPEEKIYRYLDALDERVCDPARDATPPQNSVLLGALLLPFLPELLSSDAQPGNDAVVRVEQVARPVLERMKVSRRDAERTRQVLLAQRRLAPSRRRRGRPTALLGRDYFIDALELFEIAARADDVPPAEAARWRRLLREGPAAENSDVGEGPATGEELARGTRRRRRRRRGGRRRRGAIAPEGQPVQQTPALALRAPAKASE